MYVRFVFGQVYQKGRHRAGILRGDWRRPRSAWVLSRHDEIQSVYAWLNRHLRVPWEDVFSSARGLSWCKAEARDVIGRLRTLSVLLQCEGARVWEVHSRNPGFITYEDEHQVVAVPWSLVGRDS